MTSPESQRKAVEDAVVSSAKTAIEAGMDIDEFTDMARTKMLELWYRMSYSNSNKRKKADVSEETVGGPESRTTNTQPPAQIQPESKSFLTPVLSKPNTNPPALNLNSSSSQAPSNPEPTNPIYDFGRTNGTSYIPFYPTVLSDIPNLLAYCAFQHISIMEPYQKWSGDELRLIDYNQGHRAEVSSTSISSSSNFSTINTGTTTQPTIRADSEPSPLQTSLSLGTPSAARSSSTAGNAQTATSTDSGTDSGFSTVQSNPLFSTQPASCNTNAGTSTQATPSSNSETSNVIANLFGTPAASSSTGTEANTQNAISTNSNSSNAVVDYYGTSVSSQEAWQALWGHPVTDSNQSNGDAAPSTTLHQSNYVTQPSDETSVSASRRGGSRHRRRGRRGWRRQDHGR